MKIGIIQIIALLLPICFVSSIKAGTDIENNSGWSYSIQNGIENSKRTYLLVYSPGMKEEKLITVASQCSKPYPSEGAYGICTHDVNIQPSKKNFSLNTGEDVIIVSSPFGFLILGTMDYGCCGGPNVAKFYTDTGEYLGKLNTITPSKNSKNVITDITDFQNSTGRFEKTNYFVVQDDKNNLQYYAWVKENDKPITKIPIIFTIANKKKCDEWYLSDFTKYEDRQDITLTLEGRFCENQKRTFSCQKEEKAIHCMPRQ